MQSVDADEPASKEAHWYLGFDCATKTFAFNICRVDSIAMHDLGQFLQTMALRRRLLVARALHQRADDALQAGDLATAHMIISQLRPAIEILLADTAIIKLADGGVVDLAPGRPDADVGTVERIQALATYVTTRIRPALAACGAENCTVVIEYQMGPNARARAIAAALVALFATETVLFVGPSLKNRICTGAAGQYGNFAQKYSNSYGANKAHAIHNFAVIESVFGTAIPATSVALRGHIADSFMQVLGYLRYGVDEKNAAKMF